MTTTGTRTLQEEQVDRQQHDDRAGRRRNTGEEISGPGRTVRVLDLHVEAGKTQRRADREHHRGDPAEIAERVQAPEIEDEARRDAEIEEVREAVEFRAEAGRTLDHAGNAPVHRIEHGGENDCAERKLVAAFKRKADAGQAGTQRQKGDDVWHQRADRNLAEPLNPALAAFRIEARVGHMLNIAARALRRHWPIRDG